MRPTLPPACLAPLTSFDADGYALATIRKACQLLGRILTDAVGAGLIGRTSCRNITLPRIQDTEKQFLSPTEITHLAVTIHPRCRALVITSASGNPRSPPHDEPSPSPMAPRRPRQHLDTYPPGPDWLIFTAPEGGPIRRNTFRSRFWLPAVEDSVGQPMRFHDLRHSHVALLIAQGAHPAVIAPRLGHSSVKTVLDVYGHLYGGLDRNAADTLNPPWDRSDVDATQSEQERRKRTDLRNPKRTQGIPAVDATGIEPVTSAV